MSEDRASQLAAEVLTLGRDSLIFSLRFMDAALCALSPLPRPIVGTVATDGRQLFYNPAYVLAKYKRERNTAARDYLHLTLHCVFRHFFIKTMLREDLWDLACDMAVETVINELGLPSLHCEVVKRQSLPEYLTGLSPFTAERIYRKLLLQNPTPAEAARLRAPFFRDDHSLWYQSAYTTGSTEQAAGGEQEQQDEPAARTFGGSFGLGQGQHSHGDEQGENENMDEAAAEENPEQLWEQLSRRIQVDLELTSRQWGSRTGSMSQALSELHREKYDYARFLRRFCSRGEQLEINDDEFDYIFYTYGLQLYKRMPLVEPLEYREVKRVRELVIAIDNSGSVSGRLAQAFMQKTYNLLKQSDSFFKRTNLVILHFDAEIKAEYRIHGRAELDEYLNGLSLTGFGGTDFRPVFNRVSELQACGEFSDLKGLIIFTDGRGSMPKQRPPYAAAFVFAEESGAKLPPWAIKLILDEETL